MASNSADPASILSAYPARIATMRRMSWDNLHDFVLLGAGVLLLGVLGGFYPSPRRLRNRVLLVVVTVAALIEGVYLLALWRSR